MNRQIDTIKAFLQSKKAATLCLVTVILAHGFHYLVNYEIKMVNDEWEYIKATESFLNGHLTIDYPLYDMLKEKYGINSIDSFDAMFLQKTSSGDLVPVISIGIILLLAPFYQLFGNHVFYLLPLLLDCIALVSMFMIGTLFWKKNHTTRHTWFFGLLFTVLYAVIVNFRPGLRRDLLCASLIAPLTLLVLQGIRKNRHVYWYFSFFIISFLSIVKPTYVLFYVPFVLSFAASVQFKMRSVRQRDIMVLLALSIAVFTPYFIQNHFTSGHFLIPKQIGSAKTFIPRGNPILYWIENAIVIVKAQAGIFSPGDFNGLWAVPVVLLMIIGLYKERNNIFVKYWIVPSIILLYIFHIFTKRHDFIYNIYLAPTYSLSMFLCAAGFAGLLRHIQRQNTALVGICMFLTMFFLTAKVYKILPGKQRIAFQMNDAHTLKTMIEKRVVSGSLIICDRFLCYVIDHFTHAYSVSPWMLSGKSGNLEEKIDYLLQQGVPVFFCDYNSVENAQTFISSLADHYQLSTSITIPGSSMLLGDYHDDSDTLKIYCIQKKKSEKADDLQKVNK